MKKAVVGRLLKNLLYSFRWKIEEQTKANESSQEESVNFRVFNRNHV